MWTTHLLPHENVQDVVVNELRAAQAQRDPRTYAVIGAAMAVHRELGPGFLEAVYAKALSVEFVERHIPFRPEVAIPIHYRGRNLGAEYRADFVCGDIVVELKAISDIGPAQRSQVLHYLKATGYATGLLLNFGAGRLGFERFVFTPPAFGDASRTDTAGTGSTHHGSADVTSLPGARPTSPPSWPQISPMSPA